jgi:hypothetical protein
MAVNGRKFLELNKKFLVITEHAVARLNVALRKEHTREEAYEVFANAPYLKVKDLFGLGYRSGVENHTKKGEESHYFKVQNGENEAVIVISKNQKFEDNEEIVWVTTLFPNSETNFFRNGKMN